MDLSLFPKNEEWGTGDESLDLRLTNSLKKTAENLSMESIAEFYFLGVSLKPRVYNPALIHTIELVVKALLYYCSPHEYNDVLFKKIKGRYHLKEKISFELMESSLIQDELKRNKTYRYKNQIDFYLHRQNESERNPYLYCEVKKSPLELSTKIIFKDLKNFLNGDIQNKEFNDPFFLALKLGDRVLAIKDFAEIWYDEGLLYSIVFIKN